MEKQVQVEAGAKLASPRVYVNGLPLREQAIVQHGVTYVPLRAVAEAMHCEVVYDKKTGVQIWSAMTPTPTEPTVPMPPDPHPRPAMPQVPGPGSQSRAPGVP